MYGKRMNPSSPSDNEFASRAILEAFGVFLFFGAVMASFAGVTLVWPGTALDRIWTLNPRAHSELAPLGKPIGLLFLSLAAALAIAGTGWLKRRWCGWQLAVVIIAIQILGDITNVLLERIIQGVVGVTIAGALFFYVTRPYVRACFVAKPNQIVRSHDP
jgi:hypothetical protein